MKPMIMALGLLLLTGCFAEPTNGLPEPTMEVVVPANERTVQEEPAENNAIIPKSEDEHILKLDLSESKDFDVHTEVDMATYHEAIDVLYIEDEVVLEEMYTLESLKALRDHLMLYRYNSATGAVGWISVPDHLFALCNKLNRLPEDYEPGDLVEPGIPFSFSGQDMKRTLRSEPAAALEALVASAAEEALSIVGVSGYRSYQRQNSIYSYNVSTRGVEETDRVSARPGHSEHQTGLAIDVSTASVGYGLEKTFGETPEGRWLEEHAHEFGFIIRYPEAYISNTGYDYEPWHLRYIGKEVATFLHEHDVTLEMLYATYLKEE